MSLQRNEYLRGRPSVVAHCPRRCHINPHRPFGIRANHDRKAEFNVAEQAHAAIARWPVFARKREYILLVVNRSSRVHVPAGLRLDNERANDRGIRHEHGHRASVHFAGPAADINRGYGMLCGPDPKRNDSWTLRVDVPSLRFGVVVRVNLHFCAGDVVPAILDVENRADLGRERPAVAFPCAGQPEGFRRY